MNKSSDYVGILTKWQLSCAKDKYKFGLGMTLAFRCFFLKNRGVFVKGRAMLECETDRGLAGLTAKEAELILSGDSELWHWEGEELHVDLYSRELQDKMEARTQAAKKAGEASARKRWNKPLEIKQKITDVTTNVITDVVTKKERKDFSSKNLSKGGCSSEDTHPAFEESMNEEDSAPSSPEEMAKFFAALREEVSEPETGEEQTEATEDKTPETENAPERPQNAPTLSER